MMMVVVVLSGGGGGAGAGANHDCHGGPKLSASQTRKGFRRAQKTNEDKERRTLYVPERDNKINLEC